MSYLGMDTTANYDYFEPLCVWKRGETSDILRVHVEGFQREQMEVNVDRHKITVNGEREYHPQGTSTRMKRFHKEIPFPGKEYKLCHMEIKFQGGVLSITFPKKVHKSGTIADRLGLNKLLSRLNISKRTAAESILAISIGLAVGAYATYKLKLPALYQSEI